MTELPEGGRAVVVLVVLVFCIVLTVLLDVVLTKIRINYKNKHLKGVNCKIHWLDTDMAVIDQQAVST